MTLLDHLAGIVDFEDGALPDRSLVWTAAGFSGSATEPMRRAPDAAHSEPGTVERSAAHAVVPESVQLSWSWRPGVAATRLARMFGRGPSREVWVSADLVLDGVRHTVCAPADAAIPALDGIPRLDRRGRAMPSEHWLRLVEAAVALGAPAPRAAALEPADRAPAQRTEVEPLRVESLPERARWQIWVGCIALVLAAAFYAFVDPIDGATPRHLRLGIPLAALGFALMLWRVCGSHRRVTVATLSARRSTPHAIALPWLRRFPDPVGSDPPRFGGLARLGVAGLCAALGLVCALALALVTIDRARSDEVEVIDPMLGGLNGSGQFWWLLGGDAPASEVDLWWSAGVLHARLDDEIFAYPGGRARAVSATQPSAEPDAIRAPCLATAPGDPTAVACERATPIGEPRLTRPDGTASSPLGRPHFAWRRGDASWRVALGARQIVLLTPHGESVLEDPASSWAAPSLWYLSDVTFGGPAERTVVVVDTGEAVLVFRVEAREGRWTATQVHRTFSPDGEREILISADGRRVLFSHARIQSVFDVDSGAWWNLDLGADAVAIAENGDAVALLWRTGAVWRWSLPE